MRPSWVLFVLLLCSCVSQAKPFSCPAKIHRHRSDQRPVLVDKVGTISFDDDRRILSFSGDSRDRFSVAYDSVVKVVFDVSTHMRGGVASQVISATSFPGSIAGRLIAKQHVHNYWFYIEYQDGVRDRQVLLEVPKDSSTEVIDRANKCFGSRVSVFEVHQGDEIDPSKLADGKSKHSLKVDKKDHPLPESQPGKASVVVVCPPLAARYAGHGNQFKLHANDRVIAVNRAGTYSFAYLDPGHYKLVSQTENANGFEMDLEAGQTYYLVQNTGQGVLKASTMLSRNSPEVVNFLASGSYYSDWKRK